MKKLFYFILLLVVVCSVGSIALTQTKSVHHKEKKKWSGEGSLLNVIWMADFQNQEPGIFDRKDIKVEFGSNGLYFWRDLAGVGFLHRWNKKMENDQNVFIEEEDGNRFTRNWFKAGHYGIIDTDWLIGSGHMYHPKIHGNYEELWISHNIRWPHDRDWALSGSMGVTVRGGSSPYGCNPYIMDKHNGFVLNLMWSKAREMKLSLYWPGKNDSIAPCGLSGPFKWYDPNKPGQNLILTDYADQWHNVTLRIVLNDNYLPGEGNGIIEGFWDGMLAFRVDTLRLRTEPRVYIDHARSQLNHGGNDDRFAPKIDTYIDVDDVWTWTWKKESGLPVGYMVWDKNEMVPLPNYPK